MWGVLWNDRVGVSRYEIGVRVRILLLSYFRKISWISSTKGLENYIVVKYPDI